MEPTWRMCGYDVCDNMEKERTEGGRDVAADRGHDRPSGESANLPSMSMDAGNTSCGRPHPHRGRRENMIDRNFSNTRIVSSECTGVQGLLNEYH